MRISRYAAGKHARPHRLQYRLHYTGCTAAACYFMPGWLDDEPPYPPPEGIWPEGIWPEGIWPEGMFEDGILDEGMFEDGIAPEGVPVAGVLVLLPT